MERESKSFLFGDPFGDPFRERFQSNQETQEIMKIGKEMFNRWNKYAQLLVAEHGRTIEDVTSKVTAWNIANKLNIPSEAYHVGCNDSHIETALKRIFPMAWD